MKLADYIKTNTLIRCCSEHECIELLTKLRALNFFWATRSCSYSKTEIKTYWEDNEDGYIDYYLCSDVLTYGLPNEYEYVEEFMK